MRLEGVGRRYGPRGPWVLRGVGLDLPAGTLARVTGANGTGKSTLLRLLAGVDAPSAGRVSARPPRTAYVPERFPAALPLTATGYLVHLGRIQGLTGRAAATRAGEWLARFDAAAHAHTPLAELSKGTSQKVAVAQALLADPDLLVLDEAWTGLDTAARTELDRAVRERVAAGGRVVFVDHDPRRLAGEATAEYRVAEGGVRAREHAVTGGTGAAGEVGTTGATSATGATNATAATPATPATSVTPATPATPATPDPTVLPRVRITATGGTPLPPNLPGSPAYTRAGADGRLTVTVDAPHSDALLRALLDAGWHIDGLSAPSTEGVRV